MEPDLFLKKIPRQIKDLITSEARSHRRSITQEAIVLLEEALLHRAKAALASRDEIQDILDRYAALPKRDERRESELIEYDEMGLPK